MAMFSHIVNKRAIFSSSSCCFFSIPRYQPLSTGGALLPYASHKAKDLPFVAQYLISSFDFSPDRALKWSAQGHMRAIKSPARPEAVLKFLTETGLSDAQIRAAVLFEPRVLCCNVERTLKPKVRQLIDAGFSGEILVELIRRNPHCLYLKNTLSNLLFWRDFVGNNDNILLNTIQRNKFLFKYSVNKCILPRINLLKQFGLSNPAILLSLQKGRCYMSQNLDSLRQTIEVIEELGILRGSSAFLRALIAVGNYSKDAIIRKMEFLKRTYGWSQEDVNSAFRKFPPLLASSEETVKSKMDFIIRKAGFAPASVASSPRLIGCSLERVLIPRHTVLCALDAKGAKKNCSLVAACVISERSFREKYIVPFEKDVPGLVEAYEAAFGSKVLV